MADVLNANVANVTNKTQGTYALRARFFVNLSVSPKHGFDAPTSAYKRT